MSATPSIEWLSTISRLDPPSKIDNPPDWEEAVQVLGRHGLAPIAAYNLQYRMPLADAPEEAKDFLLGYMQGVMNDNVFKLVHLKNLFGPLETPALLLDGTSLADSIYPHIAFRAVPELRLLVRPDDVATIQEALAPEKFVEMETDEPDPDRPTATLYNDQFFIKLYTSLLPGGGEEALFERAVPAPVYGETIFRPEAEDALLLHVLSMARRAFALPLIYFADLREFILGEAPVAPGRGPGDPLRPEVVAERAKAFGAERALWAALELVQHFHPRVAEKARALQPALGAPMRATLRKVVVEPAKDIRRERQSRGLDALVRLLI